MKHSASRAGTTHTTVLHCVHRINCVVAATATTVSLNRLRLSAFNGACGCMESRNLFGFSVFHRQGAVTQLMGQCRGRTHVPMPLESNPGGAALHSDCTKRASKPTFSDWPTKRVLDKSNVTVMRVLGQLAGQRLPKTYRSGVSGFAIANPRRYAA
jgi:hypothetical protein